MAPIFFLIYVIWGIAQDYIVEIAIVAALYF